jgi:hypothetical protein
VTTRTSVPAYFAAALLSLFSTGAHCGSVDLSFQTKDVLIERVPDFNSLKNFMFHLADIAQVLKKEKEFSNVARVLVAVRMDGKLRFWRVTADGKTEIENSKVVLSAFANANVPKVEAGHIIFGVPVQKETGGLPIAWKAFLTANPPRKGCNPADDVLISEWSDPLLTAMWRGSTMANKCGEMLLVTRSEISKFIRKSYSCDNFKVTSTRLSKEIPDKEAQMEEWQADVCGSKQVFYAFFVLSREGRMRMFFSTKSI